VCVFVCVCVRVYVCVCACVYGSVSLTESMHVSLVAELLSRENVFDLNVSLVTMCL